MRRTLLSSLNRFGDSKLDLLPANKVCTIHLACFLRLSWIFPVLLLIFSLPIRIPPPQQSMSLKSCIHLKWRHSCEISSLRGYEHCNNFGYAGWEQRRERAVDSSHTTVTSKFSIFSRLAIHAGISIGGRFLQSLAHNNLSAAITAGPTADWMGAGA